MSLRIVRPLLAVCAICSAFLFVAVTLGSDGSSGHLAQAALQATSTPVDEDGDGVNDAIDQCPESPGPVENDGCPLRPDGDFDGDDVINSQDECPLDYGEVENGGCPFEDEGEEAPPPPPPPGPTTPEPTLIPSPAPTVFVPASITDSGQCAVATVSASNVNVRAQPSPNADIVGTLNPRSTYLVVSQAESEGGLWYQIVEGWVSGSVVRAGGQCGAIDFPKPSLAAGETGQALPDEAWTAITSGPALCPDWLLYHSNAARSWDVYRLFEGESLDLSQSFVGADIQPTRSDDAQWVAFASNRDGANWEIYVARSYGQGAPRRVTFNTAEDINPVWGPQNNGIVFESNRQGVWQLYLFNVAASGFANILLTPLTPEDGNAVNAFWSPDGSTVYYQSDADGDWELYAVTPATGTITRLTDNSVADLDPVVSPDGAWLAFRRAEAAGNFNLYLMNLASGETTQMTRSTTSVQSVSFADSGAFLAFHMPSGGSIQIFAVSTDVTSPLLKQVTAARGIDVAPALRCGTDSIVFQSNVGGQFDLYEVDPLPLDGPSNEPTRLTFTDDADEIFPMGNLRSENNSRENRLP